MAEPATALERVFAPVPPPLAGALAAGPYNFQFTGEDSLRLTVVNSQTGVAVGVHWRSAPTPGTTQANKQVITPTSDRLPTTIDFGIGEGYLLNVTVFATAGSPKIGQTFVKLQVIRGLGAAAIVLGTVVQGYVTASQDRAWPGSPIEDSISGGGYLRLFYGTDPAAGAQISESVPTGARWEVIGVGAELATDGNVATRRPQLLFDDTFFAFMRSPQAVTVPASNTQRFFWGHGLPLAVNISNSAPQAGLLTNVALLAGHRITSSIDNGQAGDNWSGPQIVVREWLEVQS